ncbi:hypothetical protein D6C78_07436 [Aureobasidium pullulans]|uniref:Uncharacterized protein n=1 Tax=Aureobasidium pullulans TaxID=5580 RepID=A0A4T0BH01_AURPU|nr:hypothetical protein D6C78_07436 [Aureobasidium pullulans]
MAAPPVLVGEDVAPAAVPEPDDDIVVMPAADELADEEPEAELDTLEDDPVDMADNTVIPDPPVVAMVAVAAARPGDRLNVRARSGRTTRSTGYAESQSESPNRFGSDAARDDSTVFNHDDSSSPSCALQDNWQSLSTFQSYAPPHPYWQSSQPRRTPPSRKDPWTLWWQFAGRGAPSADASDSEGRVSNFPSRQTQSLGGQEPSFWDDALSNRNAANLGGGQPPAGTSGLQLSSLPPFDSFFNARPQPFLNPSVRPPPPAYSREPLPGAEYFAESQRQYDLVADLHRELDDEARHDGDQVPPVVPESADTNPDYTFQSQNLAEEVIWRY